MGMLIGEEVFQECVCGIHFCLGSLLVQDHRFIAFSFSRCGLCRAVRFVALFSFCLFVGTHWPMRLTIFERRTQHISVLTNGGELVVDSCLPVFAQVKSLQFRGFLIEFWTAMVQSWEDLD